MELKSSFQTWPGEAPLLHTGAVLFLGFAATYYRAEFASCIPAVTGADSTCHSAMNDDITSFTGRRLSPLLHLCLTFKRYYNRNLSECAYGSQF